jgi:hypothetical protein
MRDKDSYIAHPVWQQLADLSEQLKGFRGFEATSRHYLTSVLNDIEMRKDKTAYYLVPESALSQLSSPLRNISSYLQNNQLSSIDAQVNSIVSILNTQWPPPTGRHIADVASKTAEQMIGNVQEQINDMNSAASAVTEAKELLEELTSEYDAAVSKSTEAINTKTEEVLEELCNSIKGQLEQKETAASASLSRIAELESRVNDKANSISGDIMAKSYGEYARYKGRLALGYDIVAVSVAIIGFVVLAMVLTSLDDNNTSVSLMKLAVSLAIFTVSGFIFKRGTLHNREALAAKRADLTLRQYLPFIAVLDEAQKQEITHGVAERIFIKGDIDVNDKGFLDGMRKSGVDESTLNALLQLMKNQ